jgi:hypothetical protein
LIEWHKVTVSGLAGYADGGRIVIVAITSGPFSSCICRLTII